LRTVFGDFHRSCGDFSFQRFAFLPQARHLEPLAAECLPHRDQLGVLTRHFASRGITAESCEPRASRREKLSYEREHRPTGSVRPPTRSKSRLPTRSHCGTGHAMSPASGEPHATLSPAVCCATPVVSQFEQEPGEA
jgi:hypothetical protein